ncbi:MAG: hypothetical protein ACETVR_03425 [Candidatus Bathyarchaeia archaeon]
MAEETESIKPLTERAILPMGGTERRFSGPFGIWPWPLMSLLFFLIEAMRTKGKTTRRMTIFDITRDPEGRIISILERSVEE